MVEFKSILCPIDLSETSARTVVHAAALARWYDARLTILHVVPTFDPVQVRSGRFAEAVRTLPPISRDEVLTEVRSTAIDADGSAAGARFAVAEGDPLKVILAESLQISADLIVMGTHGHRGFTHFLLGSVTERVLREAPCPVLTVPPHAPETAKTVLFKRILCPIDFSPASLQAFGFAVDLARQADGKVTLFHTIEWLIDEEPITPMQFNVEGYRRHLVDQARDRLNELMAGENRDWCDLEPRVELGPASRTILQAVESDPVDLIVMGAQGRGGIRLALFGSTTQQVVRGAGCPVLTVRGPMAVGS